MLQVKRSWWIVAGWLAIAGLAQAAMYKWVDDNGVTHYTQYKPPGREAQVMVPPPPAAEDPEGAQEQLEDTLQKQADQEKAAATAEEDQAKSRDKEQQREKNCKVARSNLEALTTGGRKRFVGPDGVAVYLSEEDRQARIAEANQQIEAFCED